eukprot:c3660_g1_i1.p1 GENE.c3660_g1_i1~~c3660_g1_i1.p1  ORF type:complete len:321 (-),score=35.99 c3660_g1_i1:105-977(-)
MDVLLTKFSELHTLPQELMALPSMPADHRVIDWFGTSYGFVAGVTIAYLALCWVLKSMSFKEPFVLYEFRLIHNVAMFLLSLYMFLGLVKECYILGLAPFERTDKTLQLASLIWLFYLSKIVEFNDSIIMLLRKKYAQVTFLHLYHHASVFVVWHLNLMHHASTYAGAAAAGNCFIHVLMYGYYLLSTFNIQPWWKKYLTQMQMLQFMFMVCESIYLTLFEDKRYRIIGTINGIYAVSLYVLFSNFYSKTYTKGAARGGDESASNSASATPVATPTATPKGSAKRSSKRD